MRYFIEKPESGESPSIRESSNGVTFPIRLKFNTEYDIHIRSGYKLNDISERMNDDYLYVDSDQSITKRYKTITMPSVDGNINLTWQKYPNYASLNRWRKFQAAISANKLAGHKTNYDTVTTVGTTPYEYDITCLTADGRIFMAPSVKNANFAIFNPSDNNIEYLTNYTLTGNNRWNGLHLLPNNDIIIHSYNSDYLYKWNHLTNDIDTIDTDDMTYHPIYQLSRITMLPDGTLSGVSNATLGNRYPLIIINSLNLIENELFNINEMPVGSNTPGYLLPNGKLFISPLSFMSDPYTGYILDYSTKTTIPIGLWKSANVSSCTVISDDEILMFSSYTSITPTIINTKTLEITPLPSPNMRTYASILLADNSIFRTGRNLNGNFDPQSSILDLETYQPRIGSSTLKGYAGLLLLPDGRIFFSKYRDDVYPNDYFKTPGFISASDGNYGALPDLDACLSLYVNNSTDQTRQLI